MDEEIKVQERKEKALKFLKNSNLWVIGILIIALILGTYIRMLPMSDHGDHPGLWDITTNSWTLGPDLDPWLFERTAKGIIETGKIPQRDNMRNVPLGFDTGVETKMLPYMIAYTYWTINLFTPVSIEFASVLFPVIMFFFTIIAFFLFVREVFVKDDKESILKANIIALISTFLMIVMPVFLSRSVAGIPEKESAAFFFMFLAFYFFIKVWKTKKVLNASIFSILAAVSTTFMGLVWGGVSYINITIGLSMLIAFFLNKITKKELVGFCLWFFVSQGLMLLLSDKYTFQGIITSIDTSVSVITLFIILVHFAFWNNKLKLKVKDKLDKFPKNVVSFILAIIIALILISITLGPSFIVDKVKIVHQTIFHLVSGRWITTVAENRQPNFREWSASFGPFVGNIAIFFWLFFAGSVLLFRKALDKIEKKDAWILTLLYVFFIIGLIFSRYSGDSMFNGENNISKLLYYSSALVFVVGISYFYLNYFKKKKEGFDKIPYEYLMVFAVFILTLFTARGAVRLIMVLAPFSTIFVGFLVVEGVDRFRLTKDDTMKILTGIVMVLIIGATVYSFQSYYQSVKSESYNFVPTIYNHQWQKAMEWVRNETPKDAVFAHWWDYGYWVQSIGNRATVLDGGNFIVFWNYWMGRLVLTGDNQKDSLDFLYSHNANYLLIDSSDIGKYGAFSIIGSDQNYDRYSWIGTFLMDNRQTQETSNQTLYVYAGGGIPLDEDLTINDSTGKEVYLPAQKSGVGAIIVPKKTITENVTNSSKNNTTINTNEYEQPYAFMFYQGKQYKVNMRYLSINGKFIDYKTGIEACAFVFPSIDAQGQMVSQNPIGAMMYISPRLLRGYLSQKYILDDPFNKFPNFKLAHSEPNMIIDNLNSQGMKLPEIVYYQGVQGPIKIWKIEYTGKEEVKPEYLDTDYTKYLDWVL